VAAIVWLQFMALVMLLTKVNVLYFYIRTFRSRCAVPNMAVVCSSLMYCFPVTLFGYFLNDFEMVRFAPAITGITFVFALHMRCVATVRSLDYYYY
jgi:hypothetical protein